jgi:hypothetical protein
MKLISVKAAIASVLLATAVSACVVAPTPGYRGVVAYDAPPPVRYEVVGVAPAPGYFWVGGAWFREGGRYAWHPGYWQAPDPAITGWPTAGTRSVMATAWSPATGRVARRAPTRA